MPYKDEKRPYYLGDIFIEHIFENVFRGNVN